VAKITGKEGKVFTGKARCFDSEDAAMKAAWKQPEPRYMARAAFQDSFHSNEND